MNIKKIKKSYLLLCMVVVFIAIIGLVIFQRAIDHTSPSYPKKLVQADSLCENFPDSALVILSGFNTIKMKTLDKCYLQYLQLKANCKRKISYVQDAERLSGLINECERNGIGETNLGDLYYYSGCVYRNLKDDPQALFYYLKALEIYEKHINEKMLGRTNTQVGNILINQCIYADAEKYLKKGWVHSMKAGDSHWGCYALRDLAWCQAALKDYSSSLRTYRRALKVTEAVGDTAMAAYINTQLASLLLNMHKYDDAEASIMKALAYNFAEDRSPNLCILVKLYNKTGRRNKTMKYCEELMAKGTVYGKQLASRQLAEYYIERGEIEKGKKYCGLTAALTDSIRKISAEESVAKMSAAYNCNILDKQKQKLEETKRRQTFLLIIFSLLLTIGVIVSLFIRRNVIYKRNEQNLRNIALKAALEENKKLILDNEEKYKKEIKRVNDIVQEKDEEIMALKRSCHSDNDGDEEDKDLCSIDVDEKILNSMIYRKFVAASKAPKSKSLLTEEDWQAMENIVCEVYPKMRNVIFGMKNMSTINIRITILTRVGMRPTYIANLLIKEKSTVNSARKRLFEKNFGACGSPGDWDNFIMSIR